MENDDAEHGQGKAPDDSTPSAAKITTRKEQGKPSRPAGKSQQKKWSLKQHWKTASRAKQIKWVTEGVVATAAVIGLFLWIWTILQTKRNFEKENRSAISLLKADMLNHPQIGEAVRFRLTLDNTGRMAATNSWEQTASSVGSAITLNAPPQPNHIESGMTLPAGQTATVEAQSAPLTKEQMDGIAQGKLCIYAFGYVSYWDEFGGKQSVFCAFYKSAIPWTPQQTGLALCPHNNRILWDGKETIASDGSHTTKCQE
jgi:hypothetical protein